MNNSSPVAPLCLGLILADAIWTDPATGKHTILGTFSTIFAPKFPVVQKIMAIHAALTDGRGKTEIRLKLIRADDEENKPLFEGKGMVEFDDPRMVAELQFHLTNIVLPKAGEYRFQLWGADDLLMERRLVATTPPSQSGEPDA